MNFIYTIDPNADEPIMLIDKHIGYDKVDGFGIMGDQFTRELLSLDAMGKRRVEVWISSVGGSVLDGEKIYSAILNCKSKVDTYCMGLAASIAAVIFQAGRKRVMADYGKLMYHSPSGGASNQLNVFRESLATMISSRTGKTNEEIMPMLYRETWILANEAKENGFCDEVMISSESNRGRLSRVSNDLTAFWKESIEIINKAIPTKSNNMLKITNKLGLADQANEDSILSAIEKIENRAKEAETLSNSLKEEIQTAKNQLTEKETVLTALQAEKEAAEAAKVEAEAAKIKNEAKTLIEGFAKAGKIKNDAETIEKWTNKAVADLEEVKNLLEELPVNKVGVKLTNKTDGVATPVYNVASIMAEIDKRTNQK